jgi:hypothetical protein
MDYCVVSTEVIVLLGSSDDLSLSFKIISESK